MWRSGLRDVTVATDTAGVFPQGWKGFQPADTTGRQLGVRYIHQSNDALFVFPSSHVEGKTKYLFQ